MPLELGKVKQILGLVETKDGPLSPEQIKAVQEFKGKSTFAGEKAVEMGLIDSAELQKKLAAQAALKAEAAAVDLANILANGPQKKTDAEEKFLKANWGNDGVNKAHQPGLTDASVNAANIAQNIVMEINDNPAVAKKIAGNPEFAAKITSSVEAAANLSNIMADPKAAMQLTREERAALLEEASDGLRIATAGRELKDAKGNAVKVEDYIKARSDEIEQGHERLVQAGEFLKTLGGKDGVVDANDLKALKGGMLDITGKAKANRAKLAGLDTNGDGKFSLEEFEAAGVQVDVAAVSAALGDDFAPSSAPMPAKGAAPKNAKPQPARR